MPLIIAACRAPQPPPFAEKLELSGDPYSRGLTHGQKMESKIRSLYTRLLTTALVPMLNRERPVLAEVLLEYQDEKYDEGRFGWAVLEESAQSLADNIPGRYLEEMRGIADGAGMEFEKILILNTFFDTFLDILTLRNYLTSYQAPTLAWVEVQGLASDGIDNDGDDSVDEDDEGRLEPYQPSAFASLVGVPERPRIGFQLTDPDGIKLETVRVEVGGVLYQYGDPELTVSTDAGGATAWLEPSEPLPQAAAIAVKIHAGDASWVEDPPPGRHRFMREQWLTVATRGLERPAEEVPNAGKRDPRLTPPSIGFALRGTRTAGARPLAAHHFALLDAGVTHEHTLLTIHRPDDRAAHVTLGWTGVVWGISGMNEHGLVTMANVSDSLDHPMVDQVRRFLIGAKLTADGVPIGIMQRELLSQKDSLDNVSETLREMQATAGWNLLVSDARGEMQALEMDGDILDQQSGPIQTYGPEDKDSAGRRVASVGTDDLRIASHFRVNRDDIRTEVFDFEIPPQRFWSPMYHRSVRAFHRLGDEISKRAEPFDVPDVIELLRHPDLVDTRDSMTAAVFDPTRGEVHYGLGQVPATSAEFRTVSLRGGEQ